MTKTHWLIAGLLAAAPVGAAQTPAGPASPPAGAQAGELSKEEAERLLQQCSSKRFESTAEFQVDGKTRRTGVRICALPGEADAAWIERLEKAAASVDAQPALPQSAKVKLATDLRNEVARLKAAKKRPPLPAADALVATVPAMPVPKPAPVQRPIIGGVVPTISLPAPLPLTIRCLESGEAGNGRPCEEFERNTVLMVQADANLTTPATLRFVRKGKARSELGVRPLRQGEIVRLRIPGDVCAGVVRSQLAIEIMSSNNAALPSDTVGPYSLRC